ARDDVPVRERQQRLARRGAVARDGDIGGGVRATPVIRTYGDPGHAVARLTRRLRPRPSPARPARVRADVSQRWDVERPADRAGRLGPNLNACACRCPAGSGNYRRVRIRLVGRPTPPPLRSTRLSRTGA